MLRAVKWAATNRWRIVAATAVGGTAYMVWRTLRHIPLREILVMARERASEEIQATIQGGDGSRIVKVCIEDLRGDLMWLQDVAEKQKRLKELAKHPLSERLPAYKELSIASFTRTMSSIYSLCTVQLFVNAQVFELIRHQRQGRGLFEEAQRRFLSVVQGFGGCQEGSELLVLVGKVEAAVRRFFEDRSQSELCDSLWLTESIEQLRDAVEGPAPEQGMCRPLQADLTRALLRLLTQRLRDDSGQADVVLGMRGALDAGVQERMLVARMMEISQSELYAEAFAGLLDKAFASLLREISSRGFRSAGHAEGLHREGAGEDLAAAAGAPPACRSLPLVKLVPVVSNAFSTVMGQEFVQGPFYAQTAEVAECRNLFQVVGMGAG